MGITLEQYRSRIGCHSIFMAGKNNERRLKGSFWNTMLMMFYLHVFYLPTLKRVVQQYQSSNEVMSWFHQMMCYHVYVPLFLRLSNDIEENPGPTLYQIINVFETLRADFSQGDQSNFGDNAGKQCVAMSLTAIIFRYIKLHIDTWDYPDLNNILYHGNCLYDCIKCSVKKDVLLLTDVPCYGMTK